MSLKPNTKKNARFIAGGSAVAIAAALLLVPATGADFSASGQGRVDVNTATLSVALSDIDTPVGIDLDFMNLKPGETQSQTFKVTNTGSIAADVNMGSRSNTTFSVPASELSELKLGIVNYLEPISFPPPLNGSVDLGSLNPGQSRNYTMQFSLASSAGNEWQGQTVGFDFLIVLNQQ